MGSDRQLLRFGRGDRRVRRRPVLGSRRARTTWGRDPAFDQRPGPDRRRNLQRHASWRGAHPVYSAAMPSAVFGLVAIYGVLGSDPGDPLFFVGGILNRVLIALAFGW